MRRLSPAAVAIAAAAAAAAIGGVAAVHYYRIGLTLSHYDARGHLIVARRIVDNITPGWQQVGAVWLPLPHLLNAIPVQIDFFYRTGASGVAISIVSFAAAAAAIAWIVHELTGSTAASAAATTVFVLNPNVLYLQATPMTELLLIALTTAAVAMVIADLAGRGPERAAPHVSSDVGDAASVARLFKGRVATGVLFALACLARYEAWPVTAAALTLALCARVRRGEAVDVVLRDLGYIAAYPTAAIAAFIIFSRVVIGQWFVASGFFVPENKALGDLSAGVKELAWGTAVLSSAALVWLGAGGLAAAVVVGCWSRRRAPWLIVVALTATAAIPLAAFYRGHPFRIRYMVPLIAAEAIGAGLAAGLVRRASVPASVAVLGLAALTLKPLDSKAPMVVEAQWDRPNVPVRARVTACLGRPRRGEKIMASMGSLGHYMQETSAAGFELRDFLHEGNGDIWLAAIRRPRPFAEWVLIEEKAEGGDVLAAIAREHPEFLDGYSRVCEGAGLALYKRQ